MKKLLLLLVATFCISLLTACSNTETESNEKCGTIDFYSVPTRERTEPEVVASFVLTKEQEKEIKRIFDGVKEWTDDHSVDRLAYYYDGEVKLSDRAFTYYFTYEYNVVYYNHYFAEISEDDMEYIKGLRK